MSAAPPLVLVVDDDEDAAALLGIALRRKGLRALAARSCAEARARLAEGAIDAVVMDIALPDGNGPELIASLPTKPRAVIVVSGFGREEDLEKSRSLGIDAHFVKPVDVVKLLAKLTELLARSS